MREDGGKLRELKRWERGKGLEDVEGRGYGGFKGIRKEEDTLDGRKLQQLQSWRGRNKGERSCAEEK